jgi:hypothetical protein
LTIIQPTDLKIDFPEQQIIQVGQPIQLNCHVSGRSQPDVTWTKDGKEIKLSDRIEITKIPDGTCSMIIKQAIQDDKVTQ